MFIANRELVIDHNTKPVRVPIGIEQPRDIGGHWRCAFEIGWPERTHRAEVGGTDSMAALVSALKLIALEIYGSAYHATGRLHLHDSGGYGFPLPGYRRDVAVGFDAEF
jgi:hypothetical protein